MGVVKNDVTRRLTSYTAELAHVIGIERAFHFTSDRDKSCRPLAVG